MNPAFYSKMILGVLVAIALSMSACAKKDGGAVRVAGRGIRGGTAQGNVSQTNTPGTTAAACSNSSMAWGKIFDPYASAQFESQVKGFVSATLDPQSLGSISGNISDKTGIDFSGSFQFDAQGNLIPASSSVLIKIFDSFVGQVYEGQTIVPYVVEFTAASEGVINRTTRQFTVKFRDAYGEIVFQGQYNNQNVEGTVTYRNTAAVTGYQASSGTLGSFRAYTCALIK